MADIEVDGEDADVDVNANEEEEQPLLEEESPIMAKLQPMSSLEKGLEECSDVAVGIENLAKSTPPHDSYEGVHRWDPAATWTREEEAAVVRKTDRYLLLWVCLMVRDSE